MRPYVSIPPPPEGWPRPPVYPPARVDRWPGEAEQNARRMLERWTAELSAFWFRTGQESPGVTYVEARHVFALERMTRRDGSEGPPVSWADRSPMDWPGIIGAGIVAGVVASVILAAFLAWWLP